MKGITAKEIIEYIEKSFPNITKESKHACVKGVFQNKVFKERSISAEELIKLIDWIENKEDAL